MAQTLGLDGLYDVEKEMDVMSNSLKHGLNLLKFALGGYRPNIGPISAMWDITYQCNLRCKFCKRWENPKREEQLTFEEEKRIINELAEARVVHLSLSGGEPFLRKDIFDFISFAKEKRLKVSINTNATLIDQEMAKRIVKSGLDMLYLSLDGAEEATHNLIRNSPNAFKKVMDGIENLRQSRVNSKPKILINTTLSDHNVGELVGIADICLRKELDGLTFQIVHNLDDMSFVHEKGPPLTDISLTLLEEEIKVLKKNYQRILPHMDEYFDRFRTFAKSPKELYQYRCAAGFATVQIQPNGDIFPCPAAYTKMGNLREANFKEIFYSKHSDKIRQKIKQGKHPICWFTCMGPMNVTLSYFHPLRIHKLLLDKELLRHIRGKIWE